MHVVYNGVTIYRAMTTSWEETVEYDSSGMNMIGNTIRMSFEGTVFPLRLFQNPTLFLPSPNNTNIGLLTDAGGENAVTSSFNYRLNALLRQLSMPRGVFLVNDDVRDAPIFEAYPQYDAEGNQPKIGTADLDDRQKRNLDVAGGPKPVSLSVLQVVNQCARVAFTIEIHKIRCLGGETYADGVNQLGANPKDGFVVSNRCWTEETLDDNFYTTRTFTGKLRISSIEKSVHFYRHMYYPPLEDGFRRSSVRFSESENGLELSYTVTDKQVRIAAPYPATAFSGNVSYNIINGANMQFSMNITMVGRPDAPKKMLTARAAQAVQKKLVAVAKNANGFIEKYNISENLGDPPSVSVSVNVQLYAKTKSANSNSKDKPDVAQLYSPCLDLIGDPVEFEEEMEYDNIVHVYNRFQSKKPDAYGYEIFSAYTDETQSDEEQTGERNNEDKEGSTKNPEAYGFIKCMATAPCALMKPVTSQTGAMTSELEDYSTKVYKDESDANYPTEQSNVQEDVFDYPYSVYKSDITYDVDLARFVLPQAKLKESETVNAAETAEQIKSKTAELEEKREQLKTLKEESQDSLGGITTEPPTGENNENNEGDGNENAEGEDEQSERETQIEQLSDQIETLEKEIADLRNKISTTRVIEVARPIARARVVIEAERFGRLPEMPDPDAIITTSGDDPIIFTPLKHEITLCEPRAARNNDGVSYSCIGTYEYVMSRPFKKGDEVWLLSNPTFQSECYYPKKTLENGTITKDTDALTALYNGTQLAHEDFAPKTEKETSALSMEN